MTQTKLYPRSKRQAPLSQQLPVLRRKEYRMMTANEREKYQRAINRLKTTKIDGRSKYDILTVQHTPAFARGAHFGPAFLPFHRELLKQLELAIRLDIDNSVAIPYWDPTLDAALPSPHDSVLFHDELVGNARGAVRRGPFANWRVVAHPKAFNVSNILRLQRNVNVLSTGSLYTDDDLRRVRSFRSIDAFSWCSDPFFELVHGASHMWIGGHMNPLETSPNDPVFYMLHSYVDKLWEDYRQNHQTRNQRENQFPASNCNAFHRPSATMEPFFIPNRAGLSNRYTDFLYHYDPSPERCSVDDDCGSEYIFCNTQRGRCMSRILLGGDCTGLSQFSSCYRSRCVRNRCSVNFEPFTTPAQTTDGILDLETIEPVTRRPRPPPLTRPPKPQINSLPDIIPPPASSTDSDGVVWIPITVTTTTSRPMPFAKIRTIVAGVDAKLPQGTILPTRPYPHWIGAALAALPIPGRDALDVKVLVVAQNGETCTPFCIRAARIYQRCSGTLRLSANPRESSNVSYTVSQQQAPFLAWNGPIRKPTKFIFLCPDSLTVMPRSIESNAVQPFAEGDPDCFNSHRCCHFWSGVGECRKNGDWMAAACALSCGACRSSNNRGECRKNGDWMAAACALSCGTCRSSNNRASCIDKFEGCSLWLHQGECTRNPVWMEENCAVSCGTCDRHSTTIKALCGAPDRPGCNNYHASCQRWAGNGECERNGWWMRSTCAKACQTCS